MPFSFCSALLEAILLVECDKLNSLDFFFTHNWFSVSSFNLTAPKTPFYFWWHYRFSLDENPGMLCFTWFRSHRLIFHLLPACCFPRTVLALPACSLEHLRSRKIWKHFLIVWAACNFGQWEDSGSKSNIRMWSCWKTNPELSLPTNLMPTSFMNMKRKFV